LVLEKMNIKVNTKRISKIMSNNGLVSKGSRKIYQHYPKGKTYEEKANILNRVLFYHKKVYFFYFTQIFLYTLLYPSW